jgi:60 kDa SS-A/Ro ribonucleoprotein
MIRSLAKMTEVGLIGPNSDSCKLVVDKLNQEYIHKSRVHPVSILMAGSVYAAGRGVKGSLTWTPSAKIVEALDQAFYMAFQNAEPTGQRYMLGLDVSASMTGGAIMGTHLTPREASAAMAMVTVRNEEWVESMAFSNGIMKFPMTKSQSLRDVTAAMAKMPFSSTDCSLPIKYAREKNIPVDVFVIYTDSETNAAGSRHASQELVAYRKEMGLPKAKLIVVGMVANNFSIADPNDPGMLDVVGFSADAPQVMANFARS